MGINIFKSHYDLIPSNNPNPSRFEIRVIEKINDFVIAKIYYPDASNFEGTKILVFKDVDKSDILNIKYLDPHFSGDKFSPVARFVPTQKGWDMAVKFCLTWEE